MSVQSSPQEHPDMDCAVSLARRLQDRERGRGLTVPAARVTIARKIKSSVGTIENLVRGRIKRVDAAVRDRLRALLINELEQDYARISHELAIMRQSGAHPASDEILEAETLLARAKELLSKTASGSGPVKTERVWGGVEQGTRRSSAPTVGRKAV